MGIIVVVRGEISRRQLKTLVKSKEQLASNKINEQLAAVIRIQSGKVSVQHFSNLCCGI